MRKIGDMHLHRLSILALLPLFFLAACSSSGPSVSSTSTPAAEPLGTVERPDYVRDVQIVIVTDRGDIEATVFATKTPVTAASFLNLAKRGYYNGLTFHRVIEDFMIQGGDPVGNGTGGPGYKFENEIHPALRHNNWGILSMANSGPGTNGSQFFITHGETAWLDGKHTVFGKATKGKFVVNSVRKGDKIKEIKVLTNTDVLFEEQKARIAQWNTVLESNGF